MSTSPPVTRHTPALCGRSTVSPRRSPSGFPSSGSRLPRPSITTRTAKPRSISASGAGATRSARKNGSASRGSSRATGSSGRGPRSGAVSRPEWSTHASAPSQPRPRLASRGSSMPKPCHSSSTERSLGSCSSTMSSPSPMAWGTPAGTKIASPGRAATGLSAPMRAAWSCSRTQRSSASGGTSSRKPTCTLTSGLVVPTTIQASVLPYGVPSSERANPRLGWTWTGSRSPASSSLTSSAGSAPRAAAWSAPRKPTGSATTASRSSSPPGRRLRPSSSSPNTVVVEPTQSSGTRSPRGSVPRRAAMAGPPR